MQVKDTCAWAEANMVQQRERSSTCMFTCTAAGPEHLAAAGPRMFRHGYHLLLPWRRAQVFFSPRQTWRLEVSNVPTGAHVSGAAERLERPWNQTSHRLFDLGGFSADCWMVFVPTETAIIPPVREDGVAGMFGSRLLA